MAHEIDVDEVTRDGDDERDPSLSLVDEALVAGNIANTNGLLVILALAIGSVGCGNDPESQKKRYLSNGDRYFDKGSFKEASIMYQKALQKDMRFGQAYYKLGLAQLRLGRIAEAANALRRAVELQPDNTDAHAKLADIYLGGLSRRPEQVQEPHDRVAGHFGKAAEKRSELVSWVANRWLPEVDGWKAEGRD